MNDVGLNGEVFMYELGRIGVIGVNAPGLGRSQEYVLSLIAFKKKPASQPGLSDPILYAFE